MVLRPMGRPRAAEWVVKTESAESWTSLTTGPVVLAPNQSDVLPLHFQGPVVKPAGASKHQ